MSGSKHSCHVRVERVQTNQMKHIFFLKQSRVAHLFSFLALLCVFASSSSLFVVLDACLLLVRFAVKTSLLQQIT